MQVYFYPFSRAFSGHSGSGNACFSVLEHFLELSLQWFSSILFWSVLFFQNSCQSTLDLLDWFSNFCILRTNPPLCVSSTLTLYSQHYWSLNVCGGSFPNQAVLKISKYQLGVLQSTSILTASTQTQHQIPRVKSSVPRDCSSPHFRRQSKVQVVTWASDLPAIDLRFP